MYARAEAEIVGSLRGAVFKIEADEVAALGVGPVCDAALEGVPPYSVARTGFMTCRKKFP